MSFTDSASESEYECDYEICTRGASCEGDALSSLLPFDPTSIENIILTISDHFDFRVVLSNERVRNAALVTAGLTIAGGLIGKHYGGKIGAALGGAIGGACGVGIVVVSMRDIWEDIKSKLSELFDIVYDYLAGMGLEDYKNVAMILTQNGNSKQLACIIMETATSLLGQKILSSITAG